MKFLIFSATACVHYRFPPPPPPPPPPRAFSCSLCVACANVSTRAALSLHLWEES